MCRNGYDERIYKGVDGRSSHRLVWRNAFSLIKSVLSLAKATSS